MSDPSSITHHQSGAITFAGPDAVEVFRVATLASAMGLYKHGISPGRGCMTGPQALKDASRYTGVTYKRGEYDRAKVDLKVWIETMKSAIPTTVEGA